MESASPFHNLIPYKYVKLRYSPLIATFVEPDVENLFNQCNISFNDLFAVLGSTQNMPVRIVPHYTIMEESQDTFFGKVFNDCTIFSQSFIMPEYESDDTTVPQLSPTPDRFPSKFHYPSPEASKPLWYVVMLENLLKSCQYTNLDFTDCPSCIVYATLNSTNLPIKKADEIKKLLQFPAWMNEFITDIPIIRIVVYDGLVTKTADKLPSGSFAQVIPLIFRSRQEDSPSDLEDFYLENLFKYDEKLLKFPNFCKYLTKTDFENIREALSNIYNYISNNLETNIKTLELVYKQSKSFFGKKQVERFVQGIPWAKLSRLQIAAYFLALQKNEEARKYYKLFIKEMQQANELRLYAQFMSAICIVNSSNPQEFKESIIEIMRDINYARSLRFLMMVPLLSTEFHSSVNEKGDAFILLKHAIAKITLFWNGNIPMKSLFLALFHERLAGLCSDRKNSLFLTSRAAYLYKVAGQIPHAIRCYIWLQRGLPNNVWVLLYQTVWYQKASLLCSLTQYERGLNDWKALLALPNLSESLQDRVVNKFWAPFKENQKSINSKIDTNAYISLLQVKSLDIIDLTVPEYWKLDKNEFEPINEAFEKFISKKIVRSVSFDSWYEDDDLTSKRKKKKTHRVGVGTVIILTVKLFNKFKFPIKLEKCTLKADFHLISKGKDQKFGSTDFLALSQLSPLYQDHNDQQDQISSLVPEESKEQQEPQPPQVPAETSESTEKIDGHENICKNNSVVTFKPKENEEEEEVFVSENELLHNQNVFLANEMAPVSPSKQEPQPSNPVVTMDDDSSDNLDNEDENYDELFASNQSITDQTKNQSQEEIRRRNKLMDSFSEKFYKIDQINDTEIPGLSKEATEISFKFIPLAEGRYTVSRFEKNYWGMFDTEVACGPLTFIAKNSHPQLQMQIIDFPERCYSGQCAQFSIKMTNTGTATIKDICVLFDQNDSIFCFDCIPTNYPEFAISIAQMKRRIEPKETFFLKMILWAKVPEKEKAIMTTNNMNECNISFHFCIVANGLKCGFVKKVVTITESVLFDSVFFKKNNDTLNNVFQVTITSLVDGLTVVGLINKNCQFLKTITTDCSNQVLNKGESSSLIGLTLDTTNESAESWRSDLCDKNSVAVLYRMKDDKISGQTNLKLKSKEPKYRLKIFIDENIKVNTRSKCIVHVFKQDDKDANNNVYIRPMKFKFVDVNDESEELKKNLRLRPNNNRNPIQRGNRNSINNNSGTLRINSSNSSSIPNIANKNPIKSGIKGNDRLPYQPQRSPSISNSITNSISLSNEQLSFNEQMNGCQWLGRTTQVITVTGESDAAFDFVPMRSGVYELPGFILSFTPDFKNVIPVKVSTTFRVNDE